MSQSGSGRVPVHLVGGFLGVGKTTALRHLLEASEARDERAAVIVNDFGEASLDRLALDAATADPTDGPRIIDIPGGCVCCTAPAGLVDAVRLLVTERAIDRLFIEPTGLARTQDLVDTLRRGEVGAWLDVRPLVVLLDPAVVADPALRALPLLKEQAEAADFIVLNRVDLADEVQLLAARAWVDALWPGPIDVVQTSHGVLPPELLQWPEQQGPRGGRFRLAPSQADSTAGHAARSVLWSRDQVFSANRLRAALAALAAGEAGAPVVRLKGLFRTADGVYRLEIAGARVHEAPSPWRRDSRVDLVVAAAPDDAAAVFAAAGEQLEGALLTDEERTIDPERIEIVGPSGARRTLDRSAVCALPDQVADVAPLVPGRNGAAVAMRAVLRAGGIDLPAAGSPEEPALAAVVVAADGFATEPVPLSALDPALLLHSLDGAPLPAGKGGPFRLLIPGDAGPGGPCANVKGVVRVVVRSGSGAAPSPPAG